MRPLGDNDDDRKITPVVNYILIAINIIVFILFQKMGSNQAFLASFSAVPEEIITNTDITSNGLGISPSPIYLTLITSMFMHGGIAHIAGNMLYLWIFGDNLENVMGHVKYLVFYLLCGILAGLSHVFFTSFSGNDMLMPSLGASGAISGVLGGYLLLFPKNKVRVLMLGTIMPVPAFVTLGLWIGLQLVSGWGMLGGNGGGGVAYAAHVGGFIAGLALVKLFANKQIEA